ncbi:hypothetical protein BKA65DRAFT_554109 [Rhexocercosporidium sp. MPI-PUGE-AT-0058]|nr:hypothetical protein BKA65DRAFT_554109 [Rhexocercosporidium sp. MPI-PUGE-AT-0058]
MPIKLSNCSRIQLSDLGSVYFHEITLKAAISHLEESQQETQKTAGLHRLEDEQVTKQQRLDLEAKEKEIEVQRAELKRKMRKAEKKLQDVNDKTERLRARERELDERKDNMEKAVLRQQDSDREQIREERIELTQSKVEQEEMMEVLRLEKDCLDRDRAELADRERQNKEQIEQRRHAQYLQEKELRDREDSLLTQQDILEKDRLEFELLKIMQGEEARKANAEILERDRLIQETEAREQEDLRIAEAKHAEEDANRKRQATWDLEMEKLQAREDKLKEAEAKAAAETERRAAAEEEVEEIKGSLTKSEKEFKGYRKQARIKIDALIMENEAKQNANRVELERALEVALKKTQELQDLQHQMVEEDLERSRDRNRAPASKGATEFSKQSKDEQSKANKAAIMDTLSETEAPRKVESELENENELASHRSANSTNSPTMTDYVFINPERPSAYRDHGLTRDSDSDTTD